MTANAALLTDAPLDLSQDGIDTVSIADATSYLANSQLSVLGAHCTPKNLSKIKQLLSGERQKNQAQRIILFYDQLSSQDLLELHKLLHPSFAIEFRPDSPFRESFTQCFHEYYEIEQSNQLADLVKDKNDELKRLTIQLEEKVELRQQELEKAKTKNIETEKRLLILKQTLLMIYQARSNSEIEHGVASLLKKDFQVSWVQVRSGSQSNFPTKKDGLKFYKTKLKSGRQELGFIIFFKEGNEAFAAKDKRFFNQVAEAVALSMEKTQQTNALEEMKRQWEATFDAISDAICLTDRNFNLLRVNASFQKKTGHSNISDLIGKKCYQSLFNRESPCEGCQRGEIFQLRNPAQKSNSEVFEVYSNDLGTDGQELYFHMYRDVTSDLNLQRQVIESAKMAELGTISSSIAHELNNPIGGMLNFVQLMKMDLEGNESFYQDILEIEKGIIKCKNIVKSLLGFSRKSFDANIAEIDLIEIIEQAIKITELKTRAIGIKINFTPPTSSVLLMGRFNLLTHALRNVLQNSQESLIAKRAQDKNFQGVIELSISEDKNKIQITVKDNGGGLEDGVKARIFDPLFTTKDPETNSGLGLTLALQIVKEHNGTITVSSDKDKKLCFNLVFFKSEVQSCPSEF